MELSTPDNKPPILHILVVGFHHKKGCQVEFSHPPLVDGTEGKSECPSGWKYMSTLALPDGSHNFAGDTVFFNLPSLTEPTESVYGVSCYRQIPVEKLKIRTADVTRSTVQKSVCILARLPIYGYIEVKLSLIADAFFDQGDFSCTELLVKAYEQLNACLLDDDSSRPLRHFHVGLPLRQIVLDWRHKTLILFKLFLLQRRVVCFASPVHGMCTLILGVASLMPRLLDKGFQEVACVRTSRPLSPMPDFTDSIQREATALQATALQETAVGDQPEADAPISATVERPIKASPVDSGSSAETADECALVSSAAEAAPESQVSQSTISEGSGDTSPQSHTPLSTTQSTRELNRIDSVESGSELGGNGSGGRHSDRLTREASVDTLASTLAVLSAVNPDEYRAPITIFASGNLCLPYLSLPYMDLLGDPSVLSYVIGTSNFLFQQKRQLSDVLVDVDNGSMEVHDLELRRQLSLSTEDLRFTDYLMKHVQAPKEDAEGSEHWIRDQFQGYMLALLRTAVSNDGAAKDYDHFNAHFIQAFKRTQCFQEWYDVRPDAEFFETLPACHPFAGTLSVADMKLKIAQTMQNSESGRKINQAVNTTSRAVGGAISQAKGAFSNWWSSITTQAPNSGADNGESSQQQAPSGSAATTGASNGVAQLQQEISVTFQNSINIDDIEEGVSIHMDVEATRSTLRDNAPLSNGSVASTSASGNEKQLVDSAEEIDEELETQTPLNKPPSEAEEATIAQFSSGTAAQAVGIVEIGHEAELLDKSAQLQAAATCATVAALAPPAESAEHHCSGDVFIV